jgi:glucose/arabinose dehydrogenase
MKLGIVLGVSLLVLTPALAQDLTRGTEYTQGAIDASLHRPLSDMALTGTPNGIAPVRGDYGSNDAPPLQRIEGKPVDPRHGEKSDDHDVFPGQSRAPYHHSADYTVTTLADGLNSPWALAFLPDGGMLVTEKPGNLLFLDKAGKKTQVAGVPKVLFMDEVGLLDVALDSKFASNHRIFLSFSEEVDANSNISIASAILDGPALKDVKVIYRALPALDKIRLTGQQGSRLAVAKDGTIFATIGDRSRSPPWLLAQRTDTALGKVIHINPDGTPALKGPYAGRPGALAEIYSLGHRNQEGLAFDKNGQLWAVEHGPRGGDELNLILPGRNYGWPVIVHGIDYPGETIGEGVVERPGMEQPVYYWDPVIAPSGLAFYKGDLFPQWKNSVFIGGLRGIALYRLELDGRKVKAEEPLLADMGLRIRDVRIGPEGAVYVLSDGPDAKLMKLTPKI